MAVKLILFVAGAFTWTLVEYAVHGWLSHRYRTFVTPLHQVHHRDPSAVFAIGAWLPAVAIIGALLAAVGLTPAMDIVLGIAAGFASYEALHYRLHFAKPATRWEQRLRLRHLAHHAALPHRCLGVTTAFWDRVFGTEAGGDELDALAGPLASIEPLTGRCNLGRAIDYAYAVSGGRFRSLPARSKMSCIGKSPQTGAT